MSADSVGGQGDTGPMPAVPPAHACTHNRQFKIYQIPSQDEDKDDKQSGRPVYWYELWKRMPDITACFAPL